jgi:hypothetical protein
VGRELYVETLVRSSVDRVWAATQDPAQHQRWDLRFTEIRYAEPPAHGEPQRFSYAIRIGPGRFPLLRVAGTGVTVGERERPDGTRTSALRFGSPDPRSPIRDGSGWWRYVPTSDGVRFLTGYDYRTRWGRPGDAVDRWLLRPWMGWATAWSFDRLRIWLEDEIPPEASLHRAIADAAARGLAVAVPPLALGRRPVAVRVLAAFAGLVVAAVAPTAPGVPRARRCRRDPHDKLGRRAPAVGARLADRTDAE